MTSDNHFLKILREYKKSTIIILDHITLGDEKSISQVLINLKKRDMLIKIIEELKKKQIQMQTPEINLMINQMVSEISNFDKLIEENIFKEMKSTRQKIKKNNLWKEPIRQYYQQISMGPIDERK